MSTPSDSAALKANSARAETATETRRKGQFRWLWRSYLHPHWPLIAVAGVLMAIEGAMMGALSYMMKPMFDQIFVAGDSDAIGWVGGIILGIFLLRATTSIGQRTLLTRIGAKVIFTLQGDLLRHVMRLDLSFHQAYPPGALIDRVSGDSQVIGRVASVIISGVGRDVIALCSLLAVVLSIDWQWTLAALVGVPLLVLPTVAAQAFLRKVTHASRIIAGQMTTRLDEIFHGIVPVKLNALEPYQERRFRGMADRRISADTKAGLGNALIPGLIDVMSGLGFFAVLVYGGTEIIAGTKTVGEFMAFFTAMALAFEPMRRLGNLSGQWQQATVSVGRVQTLFETEPSLIRPVTPVPVPAKPGDIKFKDVTLDYGGHPVLRGASFTAKAGQMTALVGASGAGKSTVFNVLTRLAEPNGGDVRIGETAIADMDPDALRAAFSMVSQDALLFDETLRENLALGRTDLSEVALDAALEAAQVTPFLSDLPQGIESSVGPRGSALSGGQRQRVAIARAVLRDTPILLLDEATSALDTQSEAAVQAALEELARDRTTLVIAHRLSTVRNADQIVVMDKGRVVESGTHTELLELGGTYARLHALQFQSGEGG